MDLSKIKKAYFIGIKGVGMTALAQILQGRGINVLGSDTKEKFFTDQVLERLKIRVSKVLIKKIYHLMLIWLLSRLLILAQG